MDTLYFRLGSMAGFTSNKLADQKPGFAIPLRELIQNSLDAKKEEREKVDINIYIEDIDQDKIPLLSEYKSALEKAKETQNDLQSYRDLQQQVVEKIEKTLEQDTIKIMTFIDNGSGMTKDKLEALLDDRSHKDSNNTGGSFGVGHLSAYYLSSLRYVLYATCYQENDNKKTLFTGAPILAGYQDTDRSERGNAGRIVKKWPDNESNPELKYPDTPPEFIKNRMSDGTGTAVSILGLSENWGKDAEYAIASHFFSAICHDALDITVHNEGDEYKTLDYDTVEALLRSRKEIRNRKKDAGDILSGQGTWQSWQALIGEGNPKEISLADDQTVRIYLKDEEISQSSVALVRSNMLIARHDTMLSTDIDSLRKNTKYKPFALVIDVDESCAAELFKLVKRAEGPHHNELSRKNISYADRKKLKQWFAELCQVLEDNYLKKDDQESFPIILFATSGEYGPSGGINQNSPTNVTAKPKNPPIVPQPREDDEDEPDPPPVPPRPAPNITNRTLQGQLVARGKQTGNYYDVTLRIQPEKQDGRDETFLSFCLAEDDDKNSTKTWLEYDSIELDNQPLLVMDKNAAILGKLASEPSYLIKARLVIPPEKTGQSRIGVQPILTLKRASS